MASIDERVVAMSFENKVFEQRVATTMTTLTKLDSAIKSLGNTNGLEKIEQAANKVTLQGPMSALDKLKAKLGSSGAGADQGLGEIERAGNKVTLEQPIKALDKTQARMAQLSAGTTFSDIEKAADNVTLDGLTKALSAAQGGFSRLEGIATVALGNITSQAAMKGASFAKSFSLEPLKQGFEEYQTNLGSIQTILANTSDSGGNLKTVNAALSELNTYSDKTIYNFSEMAKNIGTFTAAGVQLKPATAAIKGIANLAALSGSNSQQASTAMYQLSQAIASGKVGLQDWNSVVNAGMGGAVFQKALMRTAENMGALKKGAVEIDKATGKATVNGNSFRDSIQAKPGQKSWLTSDVLTNTLSQFTGDMSDAQLAAKGFNAEQIKAIQNQAKMAQDAATQVKTLPQVFDVAKETIGSGWSQTFQNIFGDFDESKKTFTELSNTINGFINTNSNARNKVLGDWKKLGGRTDLIEGIKNVFKGLISVIKPVKAAFDEIFPATTGRQLSEMTKNFRTFAESLKIDPKTADDIKRTFAGIFAVFDIAKKLIGSVIGVFFDFIGVVSKGGGSFLGFTGGIGDFLVALDNAIAKGGTFKAIFKGIGSILSVPLRIIVALATAIGNLFGGNKDQAAKGFTDSLDGINTKLVPLQKVLKVVTAVWNTLIVAVGRAKTALDPWFSQLADSLSGFGQLVTDAFKNMNFDKVMEVIKTGLIGGIFVTLKKALTGGATVNVFGGAFKGVNELLEGLTTNLTAMQKNVQAHTLLAIGAAILVLAGGIFILSKIDGPNLAKAMTAVAVGLGELMGAMKLMTTGLGKTGALQLPLIAAGLIGIAVAVVILAGAMKIFATMKWEDIVKGLAGIAGSLVAISAGMKLMPATLPLTAAGLILIGVALNVIAVAVQQFATMKLGDMAKGVFAIVEALAGIALGVSMMPPTLPLTAAGLILMGVALASIGGAIKALGALDFGTLIKGLGAMMAALAGIGIAVSLIPPTIGLSAAGLLIVGAAMVIVAKAIGILGNMNVAQLVKGLAGMAGALIILAGGLTLMIATLPGSIALLAAAAALAVLVPVLGLLGTMKWSTIFKGLAAMALILVTIGTAGLIAAPALAAIGLALIPLGAGFLLVATAAKIFAAALSVLSSDGQKGIGVLIAAFTAFVALLPTIILGFIKGMVDIAGQVAALAPKIVQALGIVIDQILAFIISAAPKLAAVVGVLVGQIAIVLARDAPKLINAGVTLLTNLLNGISQNIGQITNKVADIVTKFLNALTSRMPDLINAGARFLKAFLDGVGSKFGEIAVSVGKLVVKFTQAIGTQSSKIVTAAATMMGKFVGALATFGPTLLLKGTEIITNFLTGIANKGPELIAKGVSVAGKLLKGISDGLVGMAKVAFDAIISFLHGLATVIRDKEPELIDAGFDVADAILDGVSQGFGRGGAAVRKALEQVFKLLPGWAKKILGIKSPSTVFAEIGGYTMAGYSKGIDDSKPSVKKSVEDVGMYSMHGLAKGINDNQKVVTDAALGAGGAMVDKMRNLLGIHSPSEVFRDIGMNVNRGFKEGLLGSKDDVLSAFDSLNSSLIDKIRDLRGQVDDGTKQLGDLQTQYADKLNEIAKLRSEKKPDQDAINTAIKESQDLQKQIALETVAVNQNGKALTTARFVRASLTGSMKDEKKELIGLKNDYEAVNKQIEDANTVLDKITSDRNKYRDQFNTSPDIDNLVSNALADADLTAQERIDKQHKEADDAEKKRRINQVALYKQALQDQIVATAKYQETLQKLRDLGLDDTTFTKLMEKGLSGQDFASQLLASGKTGVDQINQLDANLLSKSTAIADQAVKDLYSIGVAAAQGIVDGLKAKKAELEQQMSDLADVMVNAIKSKLKIKSPSRIFMELGRFTAEGLAQGLKNSSQTVTGAATGLADDATAALKGSLSHILDTVGGEINPEMVITPVLDLTQIKKDAKQLTGLDNVIPITAATSYGQASATSQEVSTTQTAAQEAATAAPSVVYEQNNYSPESLSAVEIYRQTRNQIGQLKSSLGVPA